MREIVVYIRSRNKFGDQIVSFAALYQLKQWWPDAQLRIAAQHDVASYYRLLPWVDDFIRYGSFLQMLRSLPRKTDMAVCLHHSSERYGLVTLLRQATVRLGFSNDRVFDFAWMTCSPWLVRNRCRVRSQRNGNEETIYGRTDHRGAEGGR